MPIDNTNPVVNFGVVGTNFISEWFVDACRRSGVAQVLSIYSRDLARAQQFASEHGLPGAVDDYQTLVADPSIDAIYIASPIAAHAQQVLQAVAAGKHVLCEKTLGASASQVQEIFAAARSAEVVVMEATRPVYDPALATIKQALPSLGTIRLARFEKQQYSSRYDRFRSGEVLNAFDPTLANAAIADIGVYCLEPALELFGIPEAATGAPVRLGNGFEGAGTVILAYPESVVLCVWSKISSSTVSSTIHGEDGTMTIDSIANPSNVVIERRSGEREVIVAGEPTPDAANMVGEIGWFAHRVATGTPDPEREQLTITARQLMDELLAAD